MRFDAETRRRGGRRGESENKAEGRSGIHAFAGRHAEVAENAEERSPSYARIDRLKPVPPKPSELRSDWQAEACPSKAVRAALGCTRGSLMPPHLASAWGKRRTSKSSAASINLDRKSTRLNSSHLGIS